ncbi:MAG: efflux RND transporter periplasmic adaptor subunit [Rikenellaceae bacterium]
MKKVNALILMALTIVAVGCGTTEQKKETVVSEYAAMKIDTTSALIATDFAAELQSEQVVEIRPRVSGYIESILVEEGSVVKKGQVLFKIDEEELQSTYNAAQAAVGAAKAQVANARLEVEKLSPLVEKGIISDFELKSAQATLEAAEAQENVALSQAENAKIPLGYATITSPVDGVVGRIVVRSGTLVSPSAADALTTVSSSGPVSAYFSINENLVLDIFEKTSSKGIELKGLVSLIPEASLVLSNGSLYEHSGKVELASGMIDMTTGSAQLKATFPNNERMLRTGASAKVRINTPHSGVVVIPQTATYDLQDKIMVYKIDGEGKVKSQNITTYGIEGVNYVVKSGLTPGDVIALEGLDYIKEGDTVKAKL